MAMPVRSSDDLEAAVGDVAIGGASAEARGVFVAHSVIGAEAVFGSVRFNLQVVGDSFAFRTVAKNHFVDERGAAPVRSKPCGDAGEEVLHG